MATLGSMCRCAARSCLKARPLISPVGRVFVAVPVRALSYEGGGGASPPWSGYGGGGGSGGGGGGRAMMGENNRPPRRPVERRPGDWDCQECGNHVFASRSVCPRCLEPKPQGEGDAASRYGGRHGGGGGGMQQQQYGRQREPVQLKAGDWVCPSCQFHNFASRQECYRCQVMKPDDAKVYGHEDVDAGGGGGGMGGGGGVGRGGGMGGGGGGQEAGGWASGGGNRGAY